MACLHGHHLSMSLVEICLGDSTLFSGAWFMWNDPGLVRHVGKSPEVLVGTFPPPLSAAVMGCNIWCCGSHFAVTNMMTETNVFKKVEGCMGRT